MASPNPSRIRQLGFFGVQTADQVVVAQPCRLLGLTVVHGGDTEAIAIELRDQTVTGAGTTPLHLSGKPVGAAAGNGNAWHEELEGLYFRNGLAFRCTGADSIGDWAAGVIYELA